MKVLIQRSAGAQDLPLPAYMSAGAAGMDLSAHVTLPTLIPPMGRAAIPLGFSIALPEGFEAQIRPRSGLALKHGITTVHGIGTIDSDYRGELSVLLINLSNEDYYINRGDRVAQIVISPVTKAEWQEVDDLPDTARGHGGFGSTGKN